MKATEFWICADCYAVHVEGDNTSFDYYYSEADAERRIRECEDGIDNMKEKVDDYLVDGGANGVSLCGSCDCCGSGLGGIRHKVFILSEEDQESSNG